MHNLTIKEIKEKLDSKEISSLEITKHFLDRIDKFNPTLNAVITKNDKALKEAEKADQKRMKGDLSPLLGVPLIHKDLFCTKDLLTTCGSKMLSNFTPPYSATIVENLAKVGMVNLGKANTDEFAMGNANETSYFGAVKNPYDIDRIPGGSSGGSASSVASRMAPIATGSDTGGSIRQPASLTNLTGIKPTYGRVSRYGMVAYASSLDQAGLLGVNAYDCALVLKYMSGFDDKDSTSVDVPVDDYILNINKSLSGLTIGFERNQLDSLPSNMQIKIQDVIKELQTQGVNFKEITLPNFDHAVSCYYIVAASEASSNLSRFDGIRYGYRSQNADTLDSMYKMSRSEGFGEEVQRRILIGTFVLSEGHFDEYYIKAQKVRRLIKNDFLNAFNGVDAILTPSTLGIAREIGKASKNIQESYLEDKFSTPANLSGLPALSMPCGLLEGMPIGVQLIAPYFKESLLFNISHKYQGVTDFHKFSPKKFI